MVETRKNAPCLGCIMQAEDGEMNVGVASWLGWAGFEGLDTGSMGRRQDWGVVYKPISKPHLQPSSHNTPPSNTTAMHLLPSLALATAASAHTIMVSVNSNPVGSGVRVPSYDGPINSVTSNDIVCNGGPNPTQKTDTVITLQAGSTATLTWRHTLTSGPGDVIDSSHKGPVMAYLKKVGDAKTDSGVGGGWFKVQTSTISLGRVVRWCDGMGTGEVNTMLTM